MISYWPSLSGREILNHRGLAGEMTYMMRMPPGPVPTDTGLFIPSNQHDSTCPQVKANVNQARLFGIHNFKLGMVVAGDQTTNKVVQQQPQPQPPVWPHIKQWEGLHDNRGGLSGPDYRRGFTTNLTKRGIREYAINSHLSGFSCLRNRFNDLGGGYGPCLAKIGVSQAFWESQ